MKRFGFMVFVVLMVLFITCSVEAQRYIQFTDSEGEEHLYELDTDSMVFIRRPDSGEVIVDYRDGELLAVGTVGTSRQRNGGMLEASISYERGVLLGVSTHRPDGSHETDVFYERDVLDFLSVRNPDGSIEATISYRNGYCEAACRQ